MYKGTKDREESLKNGTLFDDFYIQLNDKYTGRRKMIIDTTSEGWYSTHLCYFCYFSNNVSRTLLRIAHFRVQCPNENHTKISHTLSIYTKDLQKKINYLNGL